MARFETYLYEDRPVKVRRCDHPSCAAAGEYRAPRTRTLDTYYWFCLDHVRSYNKEWDYCAGMTMDDIESHIRKSTVWDRPTWPMGDWRQAEKIVRDHVRREFFEEMDEREKPSPTYPPDHEREALAMLELEAPVTFPIIKTQYRNLVKHYHPDTNGGDPKAEERFKMINQAFVFLKQIYNESDPE